MTLPYSVMFRGHPACPCQVAWIPAFEHEAQRRGWLSGEQYIYQMIGLYSGSGGTHADGGADDTKYVSDNLIWLSRQMGADATWHRPYDWDHEGGIEHVHRVLRGCPHNSPARYQIAAVDAGFNGLGTGGRGASDDGPRPLSGRTWQQGIEWAHNQEDDMAQYADQLDKIQAAATAAEKAAEQAVNMLDNQRKRQLAQTTRLRTRLDRAIAIGKATKADLQAMRADLDDEG